MDAARQLRTDGQRGRILASVIELVSEMGYERVRLRDVAKHAGVSIGTLQHYYETRDGLMLAAFSHHTGKIVQGLEEIASRHAEPWDRIRGLVEYITQPRGFRNRCLTFMEIAAASARDKELRRLFGIQYDGWRAPMKAAIEEGLASGAFRLSSDIDETVDLILTQIDGLEIAVATQVAGLTRTRMHDALLRVISVHLGLPPYTPDAPASPGTPGAS
ncbi:TetR/AcrR family transcriptional regulator [Microtetraspora sp. AC03309]|uniref:TetR/AcrR family transcriptional regulator n=1 Tax=Microtetraspora sp. AC03309 TaxID=2779376 RepID=UPI001E3F65D1|nr:TetR/AcrR family transcriptional regulator [Microtetraspora sp. AC03309]MCC5574742.1 TetR/AcrR family transcriptional regulator [Microtetraspora sp. AC03309]